MRCVRVRHLDASHAGLVRCVNREESVGARKHRATVDGRVAGWQGGRVAGALNAPVVLLG